MGIYIFNIIIVILLGILFLHMYNSNLTKNIYYSLITIQLVLIAGLRNYSVGWDTNNYVYYFSRASNYDLKYILSNELDIERGYVIFELFLSKISTNPTFLLLVIASIYCVSVGRLIYKNSEDPIISFILFITLGLFTFSMTALRQTVAITVILLSYEFIKARKFKSFLLIVLIASMFHNSALFFLPAYMLAYKKITLKYIIIMVITIPLFYILKGNIFTFLVNISGVEYSTFATSGPITLIFLMILILAGGLLQRKEILNNNNNNVIFYNFLFISIIFGVLAFENPAWLRMVYYYHIFLILFIPEIIKSFTNKDTQITIKVLMIFILILLYSRTLNQNSPFVPYVFFWN